MALIKNTLGPPHNIANWLRITIQQSEISSFAYQTAYYVICNKLYVCYNHLVEFHCINMSLFNGD